MNDRARAALEQLHGECKVALTEYLKQGNEMCRLLSAIKSHPATPQERRSLSEQRIKKYNAQKSYNSVREALFKLAGWE